jgi:rubrerythrin
MSLPTNLAPVEVLDVGIHGETLAYQIYAGFEKRVKIPPLQSRFLQLKKDEWDHRKTLRTHRRGLFRGVPEAISESEAAEILGHVPNPAIAVGKEGLIRELYAMIRFEQFMSYFYDKQRFKIPNWEARIFLEVLAIEGHFHVGILTRQIDSLRDIHVHVDERQRLVEAF